MRMVAEVVESEWRMGCDWLDYTNKISWENEWSDWVHFDLVKSKNFNYGSFNLKIAMICHFVSSTDTSSHKVGKSTI